MPPNKTQLGRTFIFNRATFMRLAAHYVELEEDGKVIVTWLAIDMWNKAKV